MNPPKTIRFETRTPLWTGGIKPDDDHAIWNLPIRTSGLLGSMRWWLEALLRGVGARVPEPERALYDPEKGESSLDSASLIFGATGYRRRFRLTIADKKTENKRLVKVELPSKRYQVFYADGNPVLENGQPKWTTPSWHFEKTGPIEGTIRLRITPLHEKCDPALVTDLLTFMSKFGALGARAQMGFGVVKIIDGESNGDALYDLLKRPRENEPSHGMPALHQMFFARVSLSTGAALTDQETFLLKCDIRRLFTDANLRHEIMGWVKPNSDTRSGAKIHMSRPYNGSSALRLWGWIPGDEADGRPIDRERAVLQPLYTYLNPSPPNTPGPFKLDSWMEWNSTRDRRPAIESRLDFFDRLRKETWQ